MSAARFSVVVPTRSRNELLARCLDRLAPGAQTFSAEQYQVLVTDDSPARDARELLAVRFPWAHWSAGPCRGPAANRNAGAAAGNGDVIVFVDDDCVPERELLAAYAGALRDDVAVYEGRITVRDGLRSPREGAPMNLEGGALWSCNFAVRRNAFERVGGFDERFPLAHLEDIDLRERFRAAGFVIQFVPEASVDHPPRRLPWGFGLARMHRAGVLYMLLHPPRRSLAWFLQNTMRARFSRAVSMPFSVDTLSDVASIPFELAAIVWHWPRWMRWARAQAALPR